MVFEYISWSNSMSFNLAGSFSNYFQKHVDYELIFSHCFSCRFQSILMMNPVFLKNPNLVYNVGNMILILWWLNYGFRLFYCTFSYYFQHDLLINYGNWSMMIKSWGIGKFALFLLLCIELKVDCPWIELCGMVNLWWQCLLLYQSIWMFIITVKAILWIMKGGYYDHTYEVICLIF